MSAHPSRNADFEYNLLDITESQWCPDCNLPSVVVLRYAVTKRKRPDQWICEAFTVACRECGVTTYSRTAV